MSKLHKIKGDIIAALWNGSADDSSAVAIGAATDVVIGLANHTNRSFVLRAGTSRLRLDFSRVPTAAPVTAGQIASAWFTASDAGTGIVELTPRPADYIWALGTEMAVTVGGLTVTGGAGLHRIGVTISGFHDGDRWVSDIPLVALLVRERGQLDLAVSGRVPGSLGLHKRSQAVGGSLRMKVASPSAIATVGNDAEPAGTPVIYVGLPTSRAGRLRPFTLPHLAKRAEVTAHGWVARRVDGLSTVLWELTPKPYTGPWLGEYAPHNAQLEISGLVSHRRHGFGGLVVYAANLRGHGDGFGIAEVELAQSSPTIDSFTITPPTSLGVIATPQKVSLNWSVSNASFVTLSGVGIVQPVQSQYQLSIDATTTFVLTAYDSALNPVVSQAQTQTVTVAPDPDSLLASVGTLMLWGGTLSSVPAGWLLCDGTAYEIAQYPDLYGVVGTTYNTDGTQSGYFCVPDMTNAFVMGASGHSTEPPQTSGSPNTHTHGVGPFPATGSYSFTTAISGAHSHLMPSGWLSLGLSSSDHQHAMSVVAPSFSDAGTTTQAAGSHSHTVNVSFTAFTSGSSLTSVTPAPSPDVGVRPPWVSVGFIVKT